MDGAMVANFKVPNQNEWTENNGLGIWLKKYIIFLRGELARPCFIVSQASYGVSYDEKVHSMAQPYVNMMVRYIVDFSAVLFSHTNPALYKSYNSLFL